MNITVGAAGALEDSLGLFRMVQAFGRTAGTDEIRGLHLPPPTQIRVATSLLCQAWAVSVTRPAIAGLVGARRAADLGAANTVVQFDGEGRPVAVSPVTPRFAALPGDTEAATNPWAEIVDHDDALFAWARSRLFDGHLATLVDVLHDLAPVGRRLLWGNVAAATAGAFAALAAAERPSPDRAALMRRDARRLLDEPGSPTEGLAEVFPVDHDGGVRLFVRRQTCCLRYRLPDAPPTCLSCRLVPEPERRRRIALKLAS
jgi:ferric iron reductase protein FhuF